jgi:hypothetical protein
MSDIHQTPAHADLADGRESEHGRKPAHPAEKADEGAAEEEARKAMKEAREQTATTDEWEPGKKRRAEGEKRREAVKKARRVMKRRTGRRRYVSGWKVRRRRAATRCSST